MTVYLGIDVGTQSVKALLYDADAAAVNAVESASLALTSDSDGTREQEAGWWVDALEDCIQRLPGEGRAAVRGIGVSGQQHGFVGAHDLGGFSHKSNPAHHDDICIDFRAFLRECQ